MVADILVDWLLLHFLLISFECDPTITTVFCVDVEAWFVVDVLQLAPVDVLCIFASSHNLQSCTVNLFFSWNKI